MKIIILLLGIFLSYADWGYKEELDMILVTPNNFNKIIKEFDEILIYFHTKTCKYCLKTDKFMHILALKYKETKKRFPFGIVNCDNFYKFCENQSIFLYPFFKLYIKEHPIIYYGERNKKLITQFLNKTVFRSIKEKNHEQLKKILKNKKKDTIISVYYDFSIQSNYYKFYELLNKYEKNDLFYYTDDEDFAKEYSLNEGDVLIINETNHTLNLKNIGDFNALELLYHNIKNPLIDEISENFFEKLLTDMKSYLFLFDLNEDNNNALEFKNYSKNNKEVKFMIITPNSMYLEEVNKLKEFFLLNENDFPTVVYFRYSIDEDHNKFRLGGEITENNINIFIKNIKNNLQKPYYKTELLVNQYYEGIRKLTRNNYEEEINSTGDKIIFLHNNLKTCKESQNLLKTFKKLKNKFKKDRSLRFYLYNITLNETKHLGFLQFPSLLLYSRINLHHPLRITKTKSYSGILNLINSRHYKVANQKKNEIDEL